MPYKLSQLVLRLVLVYDKAPVPAWQDSRRSVQVHSLYWIHGGEGSFSLGSTKLPVGAGDLFYFKPGIELWMSSSAESPLHMTMILFDAATVESRNNWRVQQLASLELPQIQRLHGDEREEIENRIKAVRLAWSPGNDWREAASQYQLLKLLRRLSREGHPSESRDKQRNEAFRQAKAFIDSHYFSDIRLKDVAASYGLSEKTMRVRFLQEMGVAPKEYLERIRNEQAIRLLEHTEESLKQIAAACGYYDEFHFSKAFKKRNGVAPSLFRSSRTLDC